MDAQTAIRNHGSDHPVCLIPSGLFTLPSHSGVRTRGMRLSYNIFAWSWRIWKAGVRRMRPGRTAATIRDRLNNLPFSRLEAMTAGNPLMVLAPHADDESLGCGGLIAEACKQGIEVWVCIVTDGTGSHPKSASYPADRLMVLRESEAHAAASALGLASAQVVFLRHRDGSALRRRQEFRQAVERVASMVRDHGIRTICTSSRLDLHRDHKAANRLAKTVGKRAGCRVLSYPIWLWDLPGRSWLPLRTISGCRIDITAHLKAKTAAIACHRSQVSRMIMDDADHVPLTPTFLDTFKRPFEVFIVD